MGLNFIRTLKAKSSPGNLHPATPSVLPPQQQLQAKKRLVMHFIYCGLLNRQVQTLLFLFLVLIQITEEYLEN